MISAPFTFVVVPLRAGLEAVPHGEATDGRDKAAGRDRAARTEGKKKDDGRKKKLC